MREQDVGSRRISEFINKVSSKFNTLKRLCKKRTKICICYGGNEYNWCSHEITDDSVKSLATSYIKILNYIYSYDFIR